MEALAPTKATEKIEFVDFKGFQLYTAIHRPSRVKAAVVLAGPFATERPYSYTPWVRWARFLENNDFGVARFDYRGIGESSGTFSDISLAMWIEDIEFIAARAKKEFPNVPLILHGLGLGGLLGSIVFKEGIGDALLLWSAPASGEEALREGLMRRMAADYAGTTGKRATWQDYMDELQSGKSIPVQGYPITGPLWNEATACKLYVPGQKDSEADKRPCRQVKLDKNAAPLIAGIGQWRALNPSLRIGSVPLNPDLTPLFKENAEWMAQAVRTATI